MLQDILLVLVLWAVTASPFIALIIKFSKQEYIGADAWQKHFDALNKAE